MTDQPATQLLISSNRSDAMKVRSRDGERIGSVNAFMIDKRSGKVAYAIMS